MIPNFKELCRSADGFVEIREDIFESKYEYEGYILMGMAVKYACLRGISVRIIPVEANIQH